MNGELQPTNFVHHSTPERVRVFLTPEQDEEVKASGHRFCVLHPSSYPGAHPGRHVMDFLPYEQAVAILDYIEGRASIHKKRRNSTPPASDG